MDDKALYTIAHKNKGKVILPSILLGLSVIFILIFLIGEYSRYQIYPVALTFVIVNGSIALIFLLLQLLRPEVVIDHDGKRLMVHRVFRTITIALRDIDMVYSRRFSWEVIQVNTGTLYIVTRNRGIIKVRNIKEVEQAKMRTVLLLTNYKKLFKENE